MGDAAPRGFKTRLGAGVTLKNNREKHRVDNYLSP
jgi:hypothetical protein